MDRRIGYLFVTFVALLAIAMMRATYLGAIRSGSLRHDAATQQSTKTVIPWLMSKSPLFAMPT